MTKGMVRLVAFGSLRDSSQLGSFMRARPMDVSWSLRHSLTLEVVRSSASVGYVEEGGCSPRHVFACSDISWLTDKQGGKGLREKSVRRSSHLE